MRALCGRPSRLLIAALTVALVGCENNPPASTRRPPPELPPVTLDTPENVARGVLTCLQAELRAVANQDESVADAALTQLRTLAAIESIERNLSRMPQFESLLGDDPIEGYIHNWESAVAYYAEGFHFDQMRRGSEIGSNTTVIVPASGREGNVLIQVTCLRQKDGTWRVSRIELLPETPTSQPVRSPATQPPKQP
jgi:hypothetical protein